MRPITAACALALLSAAGAHAAEGDRLRDLDPAMNARLNAREGLEIFAGGDWVFELGPDAPGQTGWGMTCGAYVVPDSRDGSMWQTKWGGSFTYFSTSGTESIGGRSVTESIDAGYLTLEYGATTALGRQWEAGAMVGLGTGAFFGESDDGSSVDSNGNWDWVVQIKPMIVWKPTRHLQVYAAYKFAFMSPFYNTNLIGYRSVSLLNNSLELGLTWRF